MSTQDNYTGGGFGDVPSNDPGQRRGTPAAPAVNTDKTGSAADPKYMPTYDTRSPKKGS
jgi:hypothetical protein